MRVYTICMYVCICLGVFLIFFGNILVCSQTESEEIFLPFETAKLVRGERRNESWRERERERERIS